MSAAALVGTVLGTRSKAGEAWVLELEKRVQICEADRAQLRQEAVERDKRIAELKDNELRLMKRIMKLENGSHD